MSQSGHERLVDANPNPLGSCFCGVLREDCPGGPGVLSPQEIVGPPGNYANYISLECVQRLAGDEREQQHVSAEPASPPDLTPWERPEAGQLVDHPTGRPDPEPERHVNPTGETLEEASRLLDEQRRDDEPVI
jgi:hypothetical protein